MVFALPWKGTGCHERNHRRRDAKAGFWEANTETSINERQRLMLNGFTGKLTPSQWAKIDKCSTDTALRDITDLMEKGILEKEDDGGRSKEYRIGWLNTHDMFINNNLIQNQ